MYQDDHIYHVYNRGAHRVNIFRSDFQFEFCLGLIEKYRLKYQVNVLAYCIMPNHFHLILQQREGGTISRFLQTTFNAYVQAYNRMENHSGTILEGAARKILIDTDTYTIQLAAYIHNNPVVAHLAKSPDKWKFSDCKEWMGEKPFRFEGKSLLECYFTDTKEYANFLKVYQQEKTEQAISKYLLDEM